MSLLRSLLKRDWFVGLLLTLLFLVFAETGVFSGFDRQAYNLGTRISSAKEPHEDIVVVAIDDKSLQKLGAWPWSRDVLAQTTLTLTQAITFLNARAASGLLLAHLNHSGTASSVKISTSSWEKWCPSPWLCSRPSVPFSGSTVRCALLRHFSARPYACSMASVIAFFVCSRSRLPRGMRACTPLRS